jgi:hypothetical protein
MAITIGSRTIVNYGIYKFSEEELKAVKIRILASAIRQPANLYQNFKYQKPRSFYGYWQLMSGDYVRSFGELRFENELIWEDYNQRLVETALTMCANQTTFQLVQALATGLGGTTLDVTFTPFNCPPFEYDRIVFKLFSNTTLDLTVQSEALDILCDFAPTRNPELPGSPPASPTEPTPNPDDAPYDQGSAPYDQGSRDNGETYVPEGTEPPPPFPGTGMYDYVLTWRYYDQSTLRTAPGSAAGPLSLPYNTNTPGSTSGTTSRSISIKTGPTQTPEVIILEVNVPASEPDPYFIIVNFVATPR